MRLLRTLRSLCSTCIASAFAVVALILLSIGGLSTQAHGQGCVNATNDCFTPNLLAGGCSNPSCCALVCSIEPSCCAAAWDDVCVALATKFCSNCGGVPESCFVPHPSPSCNNGAVCEAVCAIQPTCCSAEWDASCVALAVSVTDTCGEPATGSCLTPHENPNCSDPICCQKICAIDPKCCDISWDETCVEFAEQFCFTCGNPRAGSCCHSHDGPYCDDRACCEAICVIDPFCCTTAWDTPCADLATAPDSICNLPKCRCGNNTPIPGQNLSCRAVHIVPGCNDFICCDKVCSIDPFCCGVSWDATCVQGAQAECALSPDADVNLVCSSATGSCFSERPTPGCSDDACCAAVCAVDPSCCDARWDADCVTRAQVICTDCGAISAGSCLFPHSTPSCLDRACCEDVCDVDPVCCSVEWDIFCVAIASTVCSDVTTCGDSRTRPCSVPSFIPACEDERCCNLVCKLDPTCCERAWDETCALTAVNVCNLNTPNCPAPGSPLTVHGTPGCNDAACCEAVCAVNPVCCSIGWSESCVNTAKAVCVTFGGCPTSGSCGSVRSTPGCGDATCCEIVCAADPLCCEVAWSSNCVSAARSLCRPDPNSNCPCEGSCFDARADKPGCNDEVCCAGVCAIDPLCCTEAWDSGCVTIARAVCCGEAGCGDSCAGDCLETHPTPFCNDPSCCEAVCRFDPFCCTGRWDFTCVGSAQITCTGGSGLPISGNCLSAHPDLRGCRDAACSEAVCAVDPACCEFGWEEACAERARKLCDFLVPDCGQIGLPGCNLAHPAPGCSDADCCSAICSIPDFEYCCNVEWDQFCVDRIYTVEGCERYQPGCGDVCAGACCEAKSTPWCDDEACCERICLLDSYCCDVVWDQACAESARLDPECNKACPDPACGTPDAGNCCFPHDNANCSDLDCCEAVCDQDPFCCENVWDLTCAALASQTDECEACSTDGLSCGDEKAGNCCVPHNEPFCDDAKCCTLVCSFDARCCELEWDEFCVKIATTFCGCP
jgi:hypothetical protein